MEILATAGHFCRKGGAVMNKILQCFHEIIHNSQARLLLKDPPNPSKGGVEPTHRRGRRTESRKRERAV